MLRVEFFGTNQVDKRVWHSSHSQLWYSLGNSTNRLRTFLENDHSARMSGLQLNIRRAQSVNIFDDGMQDISLAQK